MEISLSKIAEIVGGEVKGDVDKRIRDVGSFDEAHGDAITFAGNPKLLKRIDATAAGAVMVPRDFQASMQNLVLVENPQVAFAKIVKIFHPPLKLQPGISSKAHIGEEFTYGQDVSIAPFAAIGNNVTVGQRVTISSNVFIGDNVVIGDDVKIHPNVAILEHSIIGNRVIMHAGTVVGSDGFGFAPDGDTYYKIPHIGYVQIDDDVEIGALNAIDRGTFGKTWIQKGVKTDNLVHVAHNVTVGEHSLLVAQVGISGSVTIGKHAVLAGQAGVAGHLNIGDNAIIGPQAGVAKSVASGEVVSGSVAMPHRIWLKLQQILPTLPELKKRLAEVEKRLIKIEKN